MTWVSKDREVDLKNTTKINLKKFFSEKCSLTQPVILYVFKKRPGKIPDICIFKSN
jgi:hypothetical protein